MASKINPVDCLEIHYIIYRYCLLTDVSDFAALGDLLKSADIYAGERLIASRDAKTVRERFGAGKRPEGSAHRHVTTNILIDAQDADHATGVSYFTHIETLAGTPPRIIQCGVYHDTFARIDGAWCFTERRIRIDGAA